MHVYAFQRHWYKYLLKKSIKIAKSCRVSITRQMQGSCGVSISFVSCAAWQPSGFFDACLKDSQGGGSRGFPWELRAPPRPFCSSGIKKDIKKEPTTRAACRFASFCWFTLVQTRHRVDHQFPSKSSGCNMAFAIQSTSKLNLLNAHHFYCNKARLFLVFQEALLSSWKILSVRIQSDPVSSVCALKAALVDNKTYCLVVGPSLFRGWCFFTAEALNSCSDAQRMDPMSDKIK